MLFVVPAALLFWTSRDVCPDSLLTCLIVCVILGYTSIATPADLLMAIIAAELELNPMSRFVADWRCDRLNRPSPDK